MNEIPKEAPQFGAREVKCVIGTNNLVVCHMTDNLLYNVIREKKKIETKAQRQVRLEARDCEKQY